MILKSLRLKIDVQTKQRTLPFLECKMTMKLNQQNVYPETMSFHKLQNQRESMKFTLHHSVSSQFMRTFLTKHNTKRQQNVEEKFKLFITISSKKWLKKFNWNFTVSINTSSKLLITLIWHHQQSTIHSTIALILSRSRAFFKQQTTFFSNKRSRHLTLGGLIQVLIVFPRQRAYD